MSGSDATSVWFGKQEGHRDHILVGNQHQPTTNNMRSFITNRYKITIHYNRNYGELYDLQDDPHELTNLWSLAEYRELKAELLREFLYGEREKAPLPMPRIAGA